MDLGFIIIIFCYLLDKFIQAHSGLYLSVNRAFVLLNPIREAKYLHYTGEDFAGRPGESDIRMSNV